VTVVPNHAAQIAVTSQTATSIQAGGTFGLTAEVQDGYGNLVGSDNGRTVTLTASPDNAPFDGSTTATTSNGIASFSGVTVNTAAHYVISPTAAGLISGPAVLGVTPAPAVGLEVAAPTSVTAGTAFDAAVSVVDTYGNVVTTDSTTQVNLNANQASTGLPASGTVTNGSISFTNVTLKTATATTLSATSGNTALTGSASVAVVAGAPATTQILSLLDQGSAPRLPHPVVGQPFDTTVGFFDSQGNPAVASGATVTLTKTVGTGSLSGTTSAIVPVGATQVTIVGSVYSVLENNVTFTATTTGLVPNPTAATITVDVAGQAATVTTSPGVATTLNSVDPYTGQPCVLSATQGVCSQYILPRGGTNNIYLFQTECAGSADTVGVVCRTGGGLTAQLVNALGPLLDAQGNAIYTRAKPATLVVSCYKTLCPHPDRESAGEKWSLTELKEDVKAIPTQMSVDLTGVPGAPASFTGVATICAKTGVVDAGKYFCIDPVLSKRDANGNFIQYLLFVGDPKAILKGT
jgi:hypothetical protein